MVRRMWLLIFAILPSRLKVWLLNKKTGNSIHPSCRLGVSYYDIKQIVMGQNAEIGSLNYFKGLKHLELGNEARIGGKFNWFTASKHSVRATTGGFGVLKLGHGSNITGFHFFDLRGGIEIGENTLIAGFKSSFWTHAYKGYGVEAPWGIRIGSHCYIGSQVIFSLGAAIGDKCMVGAGAVVSKNFSKEFGCLIAGNPGKVVNRYSADHDFFVQDHKGFRYRVAS
ncbi:MAG: hypothetical protein JW902_04005 [Syntrophaceae bacterium]|nr:hypothetical protein [Syntrophaceae bacterium]